MKNAESVESKGLRLKELIKKSSFNNKTLAKSMGISPHGATITFDN